MRSDQNIKTSFRGLVSLDRWIGYLQARSARDRTPPTLPHLPHNSQLTGPLESFPGHTLETATCDRIHHNQGTSFSTSRQPWDWVSTMGSSAPADGDPVVLNKESATGQFVRTAVCLSSITLKPLKIENIRQNPSIQLTGRLIICHVGTFAIGSPVFCCCFASSTAPTYPPTFE